MNARRSLSALSIATLCITTLVSSDAEAGWYSNPTLSWSKVVGTQFELIGRDLNGTGLDGTQLDGRLVTAVSLLDVEIDGDTLAWVVLHETRFHGLRKRGTWLGGADLIGARFRATLDDGSELTLLVTDQMRHPDPRNHDVFGYEVWYPTASSWEPLCGYDADGWAIPAVPLNGRWNQQAGVPGGGAHLADPTSFTFACEGYVIEKCVTGGYKPYKKMLTCKRGQGCEQGTLADHHQACTRALRADYWGDGTAHTEDGVLINLYDGLGLRRDSEDWTLEAEWDADGARCLLWPRLAEMDALTASLFEDDCGDVSYFDEATLLMTESPR